MLETLNHFALAQPVAYAASVGGMAAVAVLATMWAFGLFETKEKPRQTTWFEPYQ